MLTSKGIFLIKMCDCSFLNPLIICFPLLASHSSPNSLIFQDKQAFLSEPASFSTILTLSQTRMFFLFPPSSRKWEPGHDRCLITIPLALSQESMLWERQYRGTARWNPTSLTVSVLTFYSWWSFKFLWSSSSERNDMEVVDYQVSQVHWLALLGVLRDGLKRLERETACRIFIRRGSLDQHLWNQRKGSRAGLREKLEHNAVSGKSSANPLEGSETSMALHPKLG